ncbi:MAG: hypothetical protein M0R40_09730 [Firmicutes bacterium]|nr:hypothetical protein [Bacillota bacterium]
MSDIIELKNTSLEFRRISSNFLRSAFQQERVQLLRFRNYIKGNVAITNIIERKIADSAYDCELFATSDSGYGCNNQLNIPIDEGDHVKAMVAFLNELAADESTNILGIAMAFNFSSSRKFIDQIQAFYEKAFKPLIDFIIDELNKEIMVMETQNPKNGTQINQNIQNNYGTANAGEGINSNNIVTLNDLHQIENLITLLRTEILGCAATQDEKDMVLDDLEIIDEQVKSDEPKPSRLKKALTGIKGFVAGATTGATTATTLITAANALYQKVEPIISAITT